MLNEAAPNFCICFPQNNAIVKEYYLFLMMSHGVTYNNTPIHNTQLRGKFPVVRSFSPASRVQ